mmetsp:Transcript_71799/g.198194  ORF Transcript_71799/g.198194 Transcript_71799/m.198194 type:complete len:409 (+) Transcript_71799:640-1866(+)
MRPGRLCGPDGRRLGQQLEVLDGHCPVPDRRADAIVPGVTASNDHDPLAVGIDGGLAMRIGGSTPLVVHGAAVEDSLGVAMEELHRQVHAPQVPALHLAQVARQRGAGGEDHRIVALQELLGSGAALLAHSAGLAADEGDALLGHDLSAPLHDIHLVSLHVGHSVHHEAAQTVGALVHRDRVAHLVQLVRRGEACRARADNSHALAGPDRRWAGHHPAIPVGLVNDEELHRLDAHGLVDDAQRAGRLAWRRADATCELGKVVGLPQTLECLVPIACLGQRIPLRDKVAERTARAHSHRLVTERRAAVHATRSLSPHLLFILVLVNLNEVTCTLHRIALLDLRARVLDKAAISFERRLLIHLEPLSKLIAKVFDVERRHLEDLDVRRLPSCSAGRDLLCRHLALASCKR